MFSIKEPPAAAFRSPLQFSQGKGAGKCKCFEHFALKRTPYNTEEMEGEEGCGLREGKKTRCTAASILAMNDCKQFTLHQEEKTL